MEKRLLCDKAFCELGHIYLTDDFGAERTAAEQTFASVGFERVEPALVRLTRERYLEISRKASYKAITQLYANRLPISFRPVCLD